MSFTDKVIGACQDGIPVIGKELFQYIAKSSICTHFIQKRGYATTVSEAFRRLFFLFWRNIFLIPATAAGDVDFYGKRGADDEINL